MQPETRPETSILQLLEQLAERLGRRNGQTPGARESSVSAPQFRLRMASQELAADDLARIFRVDAETVRQWLWGLTPIPEWASVAVTIYGMLTPPARQRLKTQGKAGEQRIHPFSRIEEL